MVGWLLFFIPGFLIAYLLGEKPRFSFEFIALVFGLGFGFWTVLAVVFLSLRSNMPVMTLGGWGVVLCLAAFTLFRVKANRALHQELAVSTTRIAQSLTPVKTANKRHRYDWSLWILRVSAVIAWGLILYFFILSASPLRGDRMSYLAFMRHYLDVERFLSSSLRLSPDLGIYSIRSMLQTSPLLVSFIVHLAQVNLLEATVYFIPLLFISISFIVFYCLAKEVLNSPHSALVACIIQALWYISDGTVGESIGFSLFFRSLEDKFILRFIVFPLSLWLTLRYLRKGSTGYLIPVLFGIAALVFTHPLGLVLYGISFGGYLGVMLVFGRWPGWTLELRRSIPVFIALFVAMVVPFIAREQVETFRVLNQEGQMVNMNLFEVDQNLGDLQRRRLYFPDENNLKQYISAFNLINHPLSLLAIFLTPLLLISIRKRPGAGFLFGSMAGTLFLCYTPYVTPLLGRLITPWIIWRVLWILPISMVIAYFLNEIVRLLNGKRATPKPAYQLIPLVVILIGVGFLKSHIDDSYEYLTSFKTAPGTYTAEEITALDYLWAHGIPRSRILTPNAKWDDAVPGLVGHSYALTFRGTTLSPDSFDDRAKFYRSTVFGQNEFVLLEKYTIDYVIVSTDTPLTTQLKGLSSIFTPLYSNQMYDIFQFNASTMSDQDANVLEANTRLLEGKNAKAREIYEQILQQSPDHLLALLGQGQIAEKIGNDGLAASYYRQAVFVDSDEIWLKTKLSGLLGIDPEYFQGYLEMWNHYRSAQFEDILNSRWAVYRFLDHLDEAAKTSTYTGQVYQTAFIIDKQPKGVIFAHPPIDMTFAVALPEVSWLSFGVALAPDVWRTGKGDHVQFDIFVDDGQKKENVFSRYIDPKNIEDQRRWNDYQIDLTRWAGKSVKITLVTSCGVHSNCNFDWAGWAEPRIVVPVLYDFWANYEDAKIAIGAAENTRVDKMQIGQSTRPIIFAHPFSRIVYNLSLTTNPSLTFGIGMDSSAWDPGKGDGVTFNVFIVLQEDPNTMFRVYSYYLDPKNNPVDRRWVDAEIDLSRFSGRRVSVIFETTPGNQGDTSYDWAAWSRPVLVDGIEGVQAFQP